MSRPSNQPRTAHRTHGFTESVIREMSRVAREHNAINLSQGFPDFPAPAVIKQAACDAIQSDINQYAVTWGAPRLRAALEEKYRKWYGMEVDGERELTVTCGGTEAMAAVMLAIINPGDEVLVFEPFYENYGPDAVLSTAKATFVTLDAPAYRIDRETLEAAITDRTRAVVVNTPNNPTGRVFSPEEMEALADVCRRHDLIAITDEIYEHILYEGEHICLATLPDMRNRTIVVSGASKTFSVTGWRIGTIVAPPDLTDAIRKVHDFLTVGAPAPLQEAVAVGMEKLGDEYYTSMVSDYAARRDVMMAGLRGAGFHCTPPEGAYYAFVDTSDVTELTDVPFAYQLAKVAGVAVVPGSSFFNEAERGHRYVRFAFCKRLETLEAAAERLIAFSRAGG